MEVRPEGILATHPDGTPRAVVLHHIVGEDGLSYKERNLKEGHKIPVYSLVEINFGPEKGMRMFVAWHGRDCDGTPLYWLTNNIHRRPLGSIPDNETFLDKVLRGWEGGYSDDSLIFIEGPESAISRLKYEGWMKEDGTWHEAY